MKKIKYLIILLFLPLLLTSCKNKKKDTDEFAVFLQQVQESVKEVVLIEQNATISDGSIEVYKINKKIEVTYENDQYHGVVETSTTKLNDSFESQTTTENTDFTANASEIGLGYAIAKENFKNYTLENGVLTGQILEDKIDSMLNVEGFKNQGDVTISLTVKDNKLVEFTCTYKTESAKDVLLRTAYRYE